MPRVPERGSRVIALGVAGAPAPKRLTTCFRLTEGIALDTGAAAHGLSVQERGKLETVFLSHAHLDHTLGLPFLLAENELTVYGLQSTLDAVRENLLDGRTWPDLADRAEWHEIDVGDAVTLGGLTIEAGPAEHTVPCLSYVISQGEQRLAIVGDTRFSPNVAAWAAAQRPTACVVEVSYPDGLAEIADRFGHQCPLHLEHWRHALGADCPIYITHVKPAHEVTVRAECGVLSDPNLVLLSDGDEVPY